MRWDFGIEKRCSGDGVYKYINIKIWCIHILYIFVWCIVFSHMCSLNNRGDLTHVCILYSIYQVTHTHKSVRNSVKRFNELADVLGTQEIAFTCKTKTVMNRKRKRNTNVSRNVIAFERENQNSSAITNCKSPRNGGCWTVLSNRKNSKDREETLYIYIGRQNVFPFGTC